MFPEDCQAKQHNSFVFEFHVLPRVPAGMVLEVLVLFDQRKKEEEISSNKIRGGYSNAKARD